MRSIRTGVAAQRRRACKREGRSMDRGLAQTEISPLRTARRCRGVLTRTANDGAFARTRLAPSRTWRRAASDSGHKPNPANLRLGKFARRGDRRTRVARAAVRLSCVRRQTREGVPTSERRQQHRGAACAANGHAIDDPKGLDENDARRRHARRRHTQNGHKADHDTRRR